MSYRAAVSLPQLKGTHEHGSCPKFGPGPIDLKARLKCPRSGLADEIKHAVAPAFPLAERFFPIAA